MGLFLEKVKLGSTFYIKWALALIFVALRLHSSKSPSVLFAIKYHSVLAGFRLWLFVSSVLNFAPVYIGLSFPVFAMIYIA